MFGNLNPYNNNYDEWRTSHSESYGSISGWLDYNASLKSDKFKYAEYPNGIPEGTKLNTFLGKQAANFTSTMSIDIIELREGMLRKRLYHTPERGCDPNYFKGLKSFMQTMKDTNSSLKIMGYSTGHQQLEN